MHFMTKLIHCMCYDNSWWIEALGEDSGRMPGGET